MSRTSVGRLGALLLVMAVAACAPASDDIAPALTTQAPSRPSGAEPFSLYTHCGIHELSVDGRWYERAGGNLHDSNGGPPPGWGNPYQEGTLTPAGSTVVFEDELGHHETFQLRQGATSVKTICQ